MSLKDKLEFWWAKKTIKDGRDFDITLDERGMTITILTGKFKGVSFRYSPLTVIDDEGLVDFRTHIVYAPKKVNLADPKLTKLTTNILRILLSEAIPETTTQAKENIEQVIDENRNTDTSQFNQERDFYEESSPVLEKRVSKRKPRAKTVRPNKSVHSKVQPTAKSKRTGTRTPRAKRPK